MLNAMIILSEFPDRIAELKEALLHIHGLPFFVKLSKPSRLTKTARVKKSAEGSH